MLNKTGVPTKEQVLSLFPEKDILKKPKAIIECYEEIPCNPCSTSCPFDAIYIGEDINTIPVVNFDKCTGCGICVFNCPGIAILVVEEQQNKAKFKIAYEFNPKPTAGEVWHGVNREGEVICDASIEKVALTNRHDKTALVTVSIDSKYIHEFVTIRGKDNE
jgi:Fe-S-cluster-containing hydrogenase component 2